MSNIPRVYRSTDPGAPVLNGQPGSLAALLDAVLVDGYGPGDAAKASLGWVRAFSALNKRAFRCDPALHSGSYLRVDDSFGTYAHIDAYEAMSGIDSGSMRFEATSAAWTKSNQATSVPASWIAVGTGGCFYLAMQLGTWWLPWFAGHYHPISVSDISTFGYSRSSTPNFQANSGLFSAQGNLGLRVARPSSGMPGSGHTIQHRVMLSGGGVYGASGFPYPLPTTNGILLERALLNEDVSTAVGVPRGFMPGLWAVDHNVTSRYSHGAVYSGFPDLPPGTELLAMKNTFSSPNPMGLLDITNPW